MSNTDRSARWKTDSPSGRGRSEDPHLPRLLPTGDNGAVPGARELITPRLRLRAWSPADAEAMAAINRDPEVTRYLNRPVDERAVEAFAGLVAEHWSQHGFGFWAVELRRPGAADACIGFAGVAYPAFLPELADRPELGWRLARSSWGHGYATEAASAARDDAFHRVGLSEVIAIIHPENVRSQRLATKLGMAREREVFNPVLSRPTDVWQLSAT